MNRILKLIILSLFVCSSTFAGVQFDGTDDYLSGSQATNSDDSYTIFIVYKDGGAATEQSLYSERKTGAFQYHEIQFRGDISDKVYFKHTYSCDTFIASSSSFTGQTIRVVAIARASNDRQLYVNGVSEGTNTTTCASSPNLNNANIGRDSSGHYLNGVVYEVAVWNAALTAQEISILSTSGVKGIARQIQPSALVRYVLLDEQPDGTSWDGDTARDLAGIANFTGNDGANNTGLTATAEAVSSYP